MLSTSQLERGLQIVLLRPPSASSSSQSYSQFNRTVHISIHQELLDLKLQIRVYDFEVKGKIRERREI